MIDIDLTIKDIPPMMFWQCTCGAGETFNWVAPSIASGIIDHAKQGHTITIERAMS